MKKIKLHSQLAVLMAVIFKEHITENLANHEFWVYNLDTKIYYGKGRYYE